MIIVFDTTTLSTIWLPSSTVSNPKSGKPIKHAKERVEALIEEIAANEDLIVIPAPVLSEVIVRIPTKTDELLKLIRSSPWFKVEGFDAAAATELGIRTAKAMASGDKREGLHADWTKIKFDRQIVAIALVAGASRIISDDADVAAIGERWGVRVQSIEDLPIPADLIPPPLIAAMEPEDEGSPADSQGESRTEATEIIRGKRSKKK